MQVSIIAPAHNEEEIIEGFVERAVRFLRREKTSGEVIVVENGSVDRTLPLLRALGGKYKELRVESLPIGDKGKALALGMEVAKGDYLLTVDVDLWDDGFASDSIRGLGKNDVVIGSRAIPGGEDRRPLLSRLLSSGYNFVFQLVFNFKGTNTHAQLSFRREKIVTLLRECKTSELNFDTELILRAERQGLSILEVPTVVSEIRGRRYELADQLKKTVGNFFVLLRVLGPSPNWSYVLIVGAVIVAAAFRFYRFHDWFFFAVDEEHYSYMTRMIVPDGHFPAIGGPISGTKLYMAPWFLYFNAIWFWLSRGSVVFSGVVFVLLELAVVPLVYLIGKRWFGSRAGTVGALLYSGSFLMALFDRHYWNITLVPVISTLTLYSLLNFLDGKKRWLWVVAAVVGFGLSTTFSVFAIFLFALVVLILFGGRERFRQVGIFLGVVAVFHLPLLVFELRHNFWLVRGLMEYVFGGGHAPFVLWDKLFATASLAVTTFAKAIIVPFPIDVSDETSICATGVARYQPGHTVLGITLLVLLFFIWRLFKARTEGVKVIGLLFAVNFLSLLAFREDQGARHWLPSLPAFFILFGALLATIAQKRLVSKIMVGVFVAVIISWNWISLSSSWASYGLVDKEAAVKFIASKTEAGRFYLDSIGTCHKWGYRYLFSYLGHEPAGSFLDQDFEWMYSFKPDPTRANVMATVVAVNQNSPVDKAILQRRVELTSRAYEFAKIGNIEVYLEKQR